MESSLEQHKNFFIENFSKKAEDTLVDARINIENERYNNALNRIYYSIFYSVMALGYLEDFVTSKHKQLMRWFNKKFIFEEKVFNARVYEIYKEAYENRQESDYSIYFTTSKIEVEENFENAKMFVSSVKEYITKKLKLKN
jgi:uncharacterized protein (UPF0332 family)